MPKLVVEFSDLVQNDIEFIGKKAEILYELIQLGIPIPDGFVITTSFFKEFLRLTGIDIKIKEVQNLNHPAISDSIVKLFHPLQKEIMLIPIPQNLTAELHWFYRKLAGIFKEPSLNIFSSSLNNKSIVFSKIKGDANLVMKIKTLLAHYLDQPFSVIVQKAVKSKDKKSVVTNDPSINNQNLLKLTKKIQNHFYFPQEIEYIIEKHKIYVTQVKPFTGIIKEPEKKVQQRVSSKILIKGISVNPGIVTGPVKIVDKNQYTLHIKNSEIVVAQSLNESLYNEIKKAKGIVSDAIFQTSIDKFNYRKTVRIPTVTGVKNAAKLLQNGNVVTINGTTGEIYSGGLI